MEDNHDRKHFGLMPAQMTVTEQRMIGIGLILPALNDSDIEEIYHHAVKLYKKRIN